MEENDRGWLTDSVVADARSERRLRPAWPTWALTGALLRLRVDFADHDFGAVERKAVELVVEALAVACGHKAPIARQIFLSPFLLMA